MMGPKDLAFGIVVAVYPEGNSIDVLMPKTGDRLANVQCLSITGSSNTGLVDLPEIGLPIDDTRWTLPIIAQAERYMRAAIWHVDGMPICMGILLPQITQMTFQRKNFRVNRHASDVYSTINAQGDTEVYHPSGTYFRIGQSNAHEDLTSQDVDQSWAIKQNTGSAVHVHLQVANAGAVVAMIDIDPSGNIAITNNGTTIVTTTGNVSVSTQGNASIAAQGNATVSAQGNTNITASETVNIQGGSGVSITTTSGTPTNITSTGPIN
jgi:hypothetical protein